MTRTQPTPEQILDWLEGRLDDRQSAAVMAAVEASPEASRDAQWFRTMLSLGKHVIIRSAPQHLAAVLATRFEGYRRAARRRDLSVMLATLRLDSASRLGAVGTRSSAVALGPRHLLYSTDVADIALDIHARIDDPSLDVLGQLFPSPPVARDSFSVQLLRGDLEVGLSETDELGEFSFDAVSPGEYQFFMSSGSLGILLTPVPVGL